MGEVPWRRRSALDADAALRLKRCALVPLETAMLAPALALETSCYPADEAASAESFGYRHRVAPELFHVLTVTNNGALIGLVCATRTHASTATHDSMEIGGHSPDGPTLVIHSVAVAEHRRRSGFATAMLHSYVLRVCAAASGDGIALAGKRSYPISRIALICKPHLVALYVGAGFALIGVSAVAHGATPWLEMHLEVGLPFAGGGGGVLAPRALSRWWQADAFATQAFGGNPAAVVALAALDPSPLGRGGTAPHDALQTQWLKCVAEEMNLSETAFVAPAPAGSDASGDAGEGAAAAAPSTWILRWFTPSVEVSLCGHATLGAAAALWSCGRVAARTPIRFLTASGALGATQLAGTGGRIALSFPAQRAVAFGDDDAAAALGVAPASPLDDLELRSELAAAMPALPSGEMVWLGRNALPDLLVQVSWSAFRALCRGAPPDFRKLAAVGAAAKCGSFRGVIVTCALPATYREAGALATRLGASTSLDGGRAAERAADRALLEQLAAAEASLAGAYGYEPIDFVSRCFYPSVGVDEDPVTGSAHVALSPHWAPRIGEGRATLIGFQASRRGGVVVTTLSVDGPRVTISGTAPVVSDGRLWT
jgi:predicted PhzF superfamily epimerase YddE/YHI9